MLLAEDRWEARARVLRERVARHRVAWTLGLGMAAGIVTGLLPIRRVTRAGRSIVDVLAFVLSSPIGSSLIARATQRDAGKDGSARPDN